jgi:hypothetical protein
MDSTQIDTVIEARWIIPAEPYGLVLENHAIAIDKGVIQAISCRTYCLASTRSYSGVNQPSHPCGHDVDARAS